MVVCVECLPADKPWDVVSVTRRSSGVAPRACVRVYTRVLVPPNLYIHTYTQPSYVQTAPKNNEQEKWAFVYNSNVLRRKLPKET